MSIITNLDVLRNTSVLGLSVYLADPTMETITLCDGFTITKGQKGLIFNYGPGKSIYLQWIGVNDPTFEGKYYEDEIRIFEEKDDAIKYSHRMISKRRRRRNPSYEAQQ